MMIMMMWILHDADDDGVSLTGWPRPDFNWSEYLNHCRAVAAPESCFQLVCHVMHRCVCVCVCACMRVIRKSCSFTYYYFSVGLAVKFRREKPVLQGQLLDSIWGVIFCSTFQ